jgi:hypothetical protein
MFLNIRLLSFPLSRKNVEDFKHLESQWDDGPQEADNYDSSAICLFVLRSGCTIILVFPDESRVSVMAPQHRVRTLYPRLQARGFYVKASISTAVGHCLPPVYEIGQTVKSRSVDQLQVQLPSDATTVEQVPVTCGGPTVLTQSAWLTVGVVAGLSGACHTPFAPQ